jgi:hypothetical protein
MAGTTPAPGPAFFIGRDWASFIAKASWTSTFIADSILLCKLPHQKVLTKLKARPVQFGAANPSTEAYAISIEEMNCGSEVR